ncbi:MAG: RNA polymerase sigma factor [Phycisphaerae bacterium]
MKEIDAQLVARCLGGDWSAMTSLHSSRAPAVAAYFLRSGFGRADAEDMTQETFIRAFKSLRTYDASRGEFRVWLAAIARNVARRHWQRRPSPQDFDPELAEDVLTDPSLAGNPGPSAQAAEEIGAVRDCVASLEAASPELAAIIRLRYVEGRSTRGIAAYVNQPESTICLRLEEARKLLAKCLKEKGILDSS